MTFFEIAWSAYSWLGLHAVLVGLLGVFSAYDALKAARTRHRRPC